MCSGSRILGIRVYASLAYGCAATLSVDEPGFARSGSSRGKKSKRREWTSFSLGVFSKAWKAL